MSDCVCWFVSFVKVTRDHAQQNSMLLLLLLSLSLARCLFIQLVIQYTLSSTSMYTHILLVVLSSRERWLASVSLSHGKRIFIYIAPIKYPVVVNVFFVCIVVVLSLSLFGYVDSSYLFLFVQEREKYNKPAQRVDKLFIPRMCACSSSFAYAFFSLHIINFPLLYSVL